MRKGFYKFGHYQTPKLKYGGSDVWGQLGVAFAVAVVGQMVGIPFPIGFAIGSVLGYSLFPANTHGQNVQRQKGVGVQTSCKGMSVPVVYGTVRCAGNVIWMSDMRATHHKENDTVVYFHHWRSFLIALCEGEAAVLRCWQDKTEIDMDNVQGQIIVFNGDGNTGIEAAIKSCFGCANLDIDGSEYKNLCCVLFKDYRLLDSVQDPNIPTFKFEVATATTNPADIIYDLLTNTRYGTGLATSLVDTDSFDDIRAYCAANDLLFSFYISQQKPVQDWIDYICSHFWGYVIMSGGKIKLGAYRDETAVATLTRDNLVLPDPESTDPPLTIKKRLYKDTCNRIEMQWLNPDAGYEVAVAVANDEVDQRVSGKVRTKTVDMTGCTDSALAQQLVHRLLFESLSRRSSYSFMVGYKDMLLEVGDVIDLSDGFAVTNQNVRITSVSEDKDGRNLQVEAVDEPASLYEAANGGTQTSLHTPTQTVLDNGELIGLVYYNGDQVVRNGVEVERI